LALRNVTPIRGGDERVLSAKRVLHPQSVSLDPQSVSLTPDKEELRGAEWSRHPPCQPATSHVNPPRATPLRLRPLSTDQTRTVERRRGSPGVGGLVSRCGCVGVAGHEDVFDDVDADASPAEDTTPSAPPPRRAEVAREAAAKAKGTPPQWHHPRTSPVTGGRRVVASLWPEDSGW
jgi:hypothetical protein